jgi:hypothetical protein
MWITLWKGSGQPGETAWVTRAQAENVHSTPSAIPASRTSAVHGTAWSAWEDPDIPGIHGPYDYDVLLTEEKQNQ